MNSQQLDKIIPALLKAQGELQHAKKDSNNPHFKSKYADLATVLDTCKPILQANDLLITHQKESLEAGEYLITTLWHKSGQYLSSRSKLMPTKQDPQGYGSAMTYARRYDLSALIGLASEDDDGNAASEAPKTTAKAVYGTNAAMVAKYKEIQAAMEACETHEELAAVWKESSPHVLAMKKMDETFHDQLVAFKDKQKKSISDLLAVKASFPEQFMEAK